MNLSLSLRPALRQIQIQICGVCKQQIDGPGSADDKVTLTLFGGKQFAKCPCCRQAVEGCRDHGYRARARIFIGKQKRDANAPQWKPRKPEVAP